MKKVSKTKCYKHIDGVDVVAWFSDDKRYRYRLDIAIKSGPVVGRTACVMMMNPSYANEEIADKSVQFMEKIVFQRSLDEFVGVQRLIVVNQFAYIQTNKFQGSQAEIGTENDRAIKDALRDSEIIIIGWGSANPFKERQEFVLDLIKNMKGKRVFKTSSHPSRAKYDGFIKPYSHL